MKRFIAVVGVALAMVLSLVSPASAVEIRGDEWTVLSGEIVRDQNATALKCRLADNGTCARTDGFAGILNSNWGGRVNLCFRMRNNGNPSGVVFWWFTNDPVVDTVEITFTFDGSHNTYANYCARPYVVPSSYSRVYLKGIKGTTFIRWVRMYA